MRISKVCYERYSTFSKKTHMHENGIRAHCLSWFKRRKWSNNELKNLLDSAQKNAFNNSQGVNHDLCSPQDKQINL